MVLSTLCYLEKGDKYLMLHRNAGKNDANEGKWLGIGGKFQDKESPEDCLLRETCEETGLTLKNYRCRGIITFVSDKWETEYMHLFTASEWEGDFRPCPEGELHWVEKNKVLSLPIWEGDKYFFRALEEESGFFTMKLVYCGENLSEAYFNGRKIK